MGPLASVRVLDLVDERGIYGAKLLADLGADVIRVEPPGGDPLRKRGPFADNAPAEPSSLWYVFYATNRRSVTIDSRTEAGRRQLEQLAGWADVILDSGLLATAGLTADALQARTPASVIVRVSSFGPNGPWKDYLAPDLVAGALGGLAATTGDADTPPLKMFGDQISHIAGTYVAIAALSALHHARETGEGQVVDCAVHETVASVLEHVLMYYWYRPQTPVLKRQASLHWSRIYQVVPCIGGAVAITPAPKVLDQLFWLAEDGAQEDLLDAKYTEPENRELFIERGMQVLRKWAATKEAEALFLEAQRRHSAYGLVMPLDRVAQNPHLSARQWWTEYRSGDGRCVRGPGAPYRFSETPWRITQTAGHAGADAASVLAEIGWED
jgi:crotonobetainyl-CoA:carnitine CoA-transferase CaiB-like acyl-CoA transferase